MSAKSNRDLYHANDLVAVLDETDQDYHFSIFQLDENVRQSYTGGHTVRATKFLRDSENENQYISFDDEAAVQVAHILRKVLKISEGVVDEDGVEKAMFVISRKMTQSLVQIAKAALESGCSEEGEEESERNFSIGKRRERQSRAAQKKRESAGSESEMREKSPVHEEAEEEHMPDSEAEEQSIRKKSQLQRREKPQPKEPKAKQPKEPKQPKPPKQSKQKKVVEYKRGKFNTKVQEQDFDAKRDGIHLETHTECCDICSNREVFRAVNTDNVELLRKLLANRSKLTSLFQDWGCDDTINAVELALRKQNPEIVDLILEELKANKPTAQTTFYKQPESFGIQTIDTGFNDKYAYGVATRKVALGRGNREGVNAMSSDGVAGPNSSNLEIIADCESYCNEPDYQKFWRSVLPFLSVDTFKKLASILPNSNQGYQFYFAFAVRSGNVDLAAYTAEILLKMDGYGLNDLHRKALTSTTPAETGTFRAASTKKKTIGAYLVPPVFCAALNPNLAVFSHVYEILDEKFIRDEKNSGVIFYAALNQNPEILDYLLQNGVEFREANKEKMTPMMVAAQFGRDKNVELLLKKGDLSKKKNRDGLAPIHFAAIGNHTKVIEVLLDHGADINLPGRDRMTALSIAAARGHHETVKLLLDRGAKSIKKDKFKRSPLILALKNCHSRVATLLLSRGCPFDEPDSSDNHPIHYACAYGCIDALDYLIRAGANANCYNSWKLTPVAVAMLKNHFEVINKLLEYPNIDINCKDDNGRTLLSNSIRSLSNKSVNFVEMIIHKHNADIRIPDLQGNTPLHHLCSKNTASFLAVTPQTLEKLANTRLVVDEGELNTSLFIRLAVALSGGSIGMWSCKNFGSPGETPLELFFGQVSSMFIHPQLNALVPKTSTWNQDTRQYIQTPIRLHDYLVGYIELQAQKQKFMLKLLNLIASYWHTAHTEDSRRIHNELEGDKQEARVFSACNQSLLNKFIATISDYYYREIVRPAKDLENNVSCEQSLREFSWAQQVLKDHKKFVIEIIQILIHKLNISTNGSEAVKSAAESIVDCFSKRWTGLFVVLPEKKNLTSTMAQQTQPQGFGMFGANQGGLFNNNFGFRGGNFNAQAPPFNNNNTTGNYINLSSKGVDLEVYSRMKEFRSLQIKLREELTSELLNIVSTGSRSASEQLWTDRHRFCQNIISSIPQLLFISSVNALSLNNYEDSDYVLKSCQEMIQSSFLFGKKLILLSEPGVSEAKARLAGQESTLLAGIVRSLPLMFNSLSSYTDPTNKNTDLKILMLEVNNRLEFIEWLIEQINLATPVQVAEIRASLVRDLDQKASSSTELARIELQRSRRKYQKSLFDCVHELATTGFTNFCCHITKQATLARSELDYEKRLLIQKRCFEIAGYLIRLFQNYSDKSFTPFYKQPLLEALCELASNTYINTYNAVEEVHNQKDLALRKPLKKKIIDYNKSVCRERANFRAAFFRFVSGMLLESRGKKPVDDEVTQQDFAFADRLTKVSFKVTSLWKLLHTASQAVLKDNQSALYTRLYIELDGLIDTDAELANLQREEIAFATDLVNRAIESELFLDVSLDQYTTGIALQSFMNSIPSLFVQDGSSLASQSIEGLERNAQIQLIRSFSHLMDQLFTRAFDRSKPLPAFLKSKLEVQVFEEEKQLSIIVKKELIDLLLENGEMPLYHLLEILSNTSHYSVFNFYDLKNFEADLEALQACELVRNGFLSKLLHLCVELFDLRRNANFVGSWTKAFLWPAILKAQLCVEDHPRVVANHELPEKNNDAQFVSLIEAVNSLREPFIIEVSDLIISKFELLKTDPLNKFLLEYLFDIYRKKGWTRVAHDMLIKVFEKFFAVFGDPSIVSLPKVKNPLFAIAVNPNFEAAAWRPFKRVDFAFFQFVLSKASNPNVKFTFERDHKIFELSLFDEGFASRNSNFLRALLQMPNYNSDELFDPEEKERLHYGLKFISSEEDLEFFRVFIDKVKIDELILEHRLNGFTPFLRFIQQYQDNKDNELDFLKRNPHLFIEVLRLMARAGCNMNAVYDNQEALLLERTQNIEFKHKHRQMRNALFFALNKQPSIDLLNFLIFEAKVNPNHQDVGGYTVTHLLTGHYQNELEIFELMFKAKVDLNLVDEQLETPIFDVVREDNLPLIKKLFDAGASLEVINKEEKSPLVLFIEQKNIEGIEFLLKLGADVNFQDRFHRNSLHWAINFADHTANSSFEIEDILIRNGVEINLKDLLGRTPLHYPFVKVNDYTYTFLVDPIESVNSLLSKKNLKVDEADIFGNTPILYAAQRGSLVSALYLTDREADLNLKNLEGNNSFAVAMISSHEHLAITLLNKGADWNTEVFIYSKNKRLKIYQRVLERVREQVTRTGHTNPSEIQQFILEQLAHFDEEEEKKDPGFNTLTRMHAFKWAIRNNWQGLAYMILSRGYDIGKAVYATIEERKFNYTFTLLTKKEENEPYLFVGQDGDNIAHLTCYSASEVKKDLLEKIFRVLVKKGISLDSKNNKGHTSLHCAAVCGSVEMISFLLELKIDPDVTDSENRTPMMLAAQRKNFEALKILFDCTRCRDEVDAEGKNLLHHLATFASVSDEQLAEYIKKVVEHVNFSKRDKQGKLPLHYLLKRGDLLPKACLALLQLCVDCNASDNKGQSLLHVALKHSAANDIVDQLISRKVDPNLSDVFGRTALGYLVSTGTYSDARRIKVIDSLVKLGLDLNAQASFFWATDQKTSNPIYKRIAPIDYLLARETHSLEKTQHLLKKNVLLDQANDLNLVTLQFILEHRPADFSHALDFLLDPKICLQQFTSRFKVKISTGTYKDREVSGLCYLLHRSCRSELIRRLVARGNNINLEDENGISALSFAVSEMLFQYIPDLLAGQSAAGYPLKLDIKVPKKACLFDTNPSCTTPLNYSIKYNHPHVVESLIVNGANRNFRAEEQKPPVYYLLKYWINSEHFHSFLRNFVPEDKYAIKFAHAEQLSRFDLNFAIPMKRMIGLDKEEEYLVSPLYFAVAHRISTRNLQILLENYPALNYVNPFNGETAFSLALQNNVESAKMILKLATFELNSIGQRLIHLPREDPRTQQQMKLHLNLPYEIRTVVLKEEKVERFLPLNFLYSLNVKPSHILRAIRHGADFNLKDPMKGQNLIMLAILENDYDLIKEIHELVRANKCVPFDSDVVDSIERTPIHLIVNSHRNGSYENIKLLNLLAKYYDINKKDKSGFPPIYYASLQDSGVLLNALIELGAIEFEVPFGVRRAPTSLISFATFPPITPDFEADSDAFIKLKDEEFKQQLKNEPSRVVLDSHVPSNVKNTSKVCLDDRNNPYDIFMTKVDIQKGQYSGSVFYRMQLLHETNRDVFIVYTRYGRIGDSGQHQLTFFANKDEALAEFSNIFKSKSGNDWANIENFQRIKKKYKLVKFRNETEKEHLMDFYDQYHEKDLPRTTLSNVVKTFLKEVVSSKTLYSRMSQFNIDVSKLPLSKLNKTDLMQALTVLHEIKRLAAELEQERSVDLADSDPEKIFDLLDEISELTSEYYELVPSTRFRKSAIPPLERKSDIDQAIMTVRELLEVEVAVKILLGARHCIANVHPIEYCHNSLNIKLMELDEQSVERSAILDYMSKTMDYGHPDLTTIFALERKGETERFQKFLNTPNRKLLWHGSKTMNFLGILNKGLKIAPPEAPATGQMFGKGIYFTDSFAKGFNYTDGSLRLVLLCEVALGKSWELMKATAVSPPLPDGCLSVMGVGMNSPDPNKDVVIPNGMILPLGKIIQRIDTTGNLSLNNNEYVVYNEEQVKIRYLVVMRR